jgi:hypothetical protein
MNKISQAILLGLLLAFVLILIFLIGMMTAKHKAIKVGRIEYQGVIYNVEKIEEDDQK